MCVKLAAFSIFFFLTVNVMLTDTVNLTLLKNLEEGGKKLDSKWQKYG